MPELFISKDDLRSLTDVASGAVAPSGEHPALECFHFSVLKNRVTVTASNQYHTVVTWVGLDTQEEFEFLAPAAKLKQIISSSPQGIMQLTSKGTVLNVVAGTTVWDVKVPKVEFPKRDKPSKTAVSIETDLFQGALMATRRSMAEDTTRPSLRMLCIRNGTITACDGSALSQAKLGEDFPRDFTAFIPFQSDKLVWEMVRKDTSGKIGIADTPTHCVFTAGNVSIMAKKLSSSFPDVSNILLRPALENKQSFSVDSKELLKAVDRVRINADQNTDVIGLSLSAKSVTVAAKDANGNSSSETIPSTWMGKDRIVAINYKYLTTIVRGAGKEESHFFLGDDTKSRKSLLLMKDEEAGIYGVIPQLSGNIQLF